MLLYFKVKCTKLYVFAGLILLAIQKTTLLITQKCFESWNVLFFFLSFCEFGLASKFHVRIIMVFTNVKLLLEMYRYQRFGDHLAARAHQTDIWYV